MTSVIVAGGHSAGHIEPAMAVADAMRQIDPHTRITAVGTARGLDTVLIPARGYPLELIPPVPLPRRLTGALLQVPGLMAEAVRVAGGVLDAVDADAVVGFGGYVALPTYFAARRRQIPIVVHEANARPGIANRVAARLTPYVFTASAAVRLPHAEPIGIPLRPEISHLDRDQLRESARAELGLEPDRPTLLVTGGSQGAQAINGAVCAAVEGLRAAGIQVLHIAGPQNVAGLTSRPAPVPYRVVPYVEHMRLAYAAADLVLCRAGAMTCAEMAAVGLPAIYVPLPLRGGEQRFNAEPVVAAGGGLIVTNSALTGPWIIHTVVGLVTDPARLRAMGAAAAHAGARDADQVLARHVLTVAAEHERFGPRR